jgi:DNA-binding CsgD family transcriptional regulator
MPYTDDAVTREDLEKVLFQVRAGETTPQAIADRLGWTEKKVWVAIHRLETESRVRSRVQKRVLLVSSVSSAA